MKRLKRLGFTFLGVMFLMLAAQLGEELSVPGVHGVVPTADAIVGRPLTPVSVAGVARRSVRRCAVGVYRC
jgi:hypothetical protein